MMDPSKHKALVEELQKEYLNGFFKKYFRLFGFYKEKNWAGIQLEYHNLKGTGTTYGMPEVTDLCKNMENLCLKKNQIQREWIEISIILLDKISEKYRKQSDFNLQTDSQFIRIKKLIENSQ